MQVTRKVLVDRMGRVSAVFPDVCCPNLKIKPFALLQVMVLYELDVKIKWKAVIKGADGQVLCLPEHSVKSTCACTHSVRA
jgi:hypothetical protein